MDQNVESKEDRTRVYLDSNVLIDYFRDNENAKNVQMLLEKVENGLLELYVSNRVDYEIGKGTSDKLEAEVEFVERQKHVSCTGKYGMGKYTNGDKYPSAYNRKTWQQIKKILFPNIHLFAPPENETIKQKEKRIGRIVDCDHLLAASGVKLKGGDSFPPVEYYITNDAKDQIKDDKRERLQKLLGIKICTLDEFLSLH